MSSISDCILRKQFRRIDEVYKIDRNEVEKVKTDFEMMIDGWNISFAVDFHQIYNYLHPKKRKDEDKERPLTDAGWAETKKIAFLLYANKNFRINEIFHSGKTRAKQTAEMIGQHLEIPDKVKIGNDLNPMDDPVIWQEIILKLKHDIMIVGHLPHLEKLTNKLLKTEKDKTIIKFQNSCVLCLESDEQGNWIVKWFIVPEALP